MTNPFAAPQVPTLRVDFNNDDDSDVIRALRKRASDPDNLFVGQGLRLEDAEGNACLGRVVKLSGPSVWVKALYSTWIDAAPVTVTDDLDSMLMNRVRFTADSDTTTSTEIAALT